MSGSGSGRSQASFCNSNRKDRYADEDQTARKTDSDRAKTYRNILYEEVYPYIWRSGGESSRILFLATLRLKFALTYYFVASVTVAEVSVSEVSAFKRDVLGESLYLQDINLAMDGDELVMSESITNLFSSCMLQNELA